MKKIIIPIILLSILGLIEILSISFKLFIFQFLWIILGFIFVGMSLKIRWRNIFNYTWLIWLIYIMAVIFLVLTLIWGPVIRGTKGWLVLGLFRFQPVEFVKIALILVYAAYFSRRHIIIARWRIIFESLILFLIPAGLVSLQPDLGSLLILFGIWLGFIFLIGLPLKRLMVFFISLLILGLIGWNYFLKDYHRERIIGIFYPERNVLTINYSVIQSKIAIGAGGLWGRGFRGGTQTQLGFLTEPATDFIFAALVEEWGLMAGLLVIIFFVYFFISLIKMAMMSYSNFMKFIYLGGGIVFALHFFINICSAVGLFPVVGIPLPFVSYGGSNLLANFFILGIMISFYRYL